jgi:excisionase family DNA binding protein
MQSKRSFTLMEAAQRLGISRAAVHKAIRTGRLRARYRLVKLRAWLIDESDLRAYRVSPSHQEAGKKLLNG